MTDAFILDHVRTPRGRGKPDGSLHTASTLHLAATALKAIKDRNHLEPAQVDDVVMGCVDPVGEAGGDIARMGALAAGFGDSVPGVQINRFCASGLDSVNFAAAQVMSGQHDLTIGGGVELMSRVGIGASGGAWPADPSLAIPAYFMPQGVSADLIATKYGFSRDDVDAYAVELQKRAAAAWGEARFKKSIAPVLDVNGLPLLERDEHMRPTTDMQSLASLKPSFVIPGEQGGFDAVAIQAHPDVERIIHVHHAGNSSGIVDGAAAVLLGSREAGAKAGLKPRGRIRAFANIGSEPAIMLTGPVDVTKKVLARSGMSIKDIDLFEVNEAFAAVVLRFCQAFDVDPEKVNVNGGAIAMGHPFGSDRRDDPRHGARRARAHRQEHGPHHPLHRRRHGHRHDHRTRLIARRRFIMNLTNFRFETDTDGIALVTWDMPGRSMNVINAEVIAEIGKIVDRIAGDAAIKGAVMSFGKGVGGADLTMLKTAGDEFARRAKAEGKEAAMRAFVDGTKQVNLVFRRLETCGKPVAAAIDGVCMGGGFELALACHYRIVADSDKTRVGLPEVKVGLFPGGGGTQRVARLMPTPDALQMLLKGDQIRPAAAKKMGLVHEVAPADQIVALAKAWVKANPHAKAPWDDPKYKLPSGKVFSAPGMMIWPPANAIYRRETYDNYPAIRAILTCVFEGLQLPMDLALMVESKHFANILLSKEAAAMIRTNFLSMGELNKGARRPADVPATKLNKIGVLGAGFMGAGIAYVSANAGLEVVLIDRDQESADKGKAYSDKIVSGQIAKGRAKAADKEALLARITATPDYAALKGCDLVVEAVFEDRAVKAEATKKAQAVLGPDVVFASNTSTLPITSLAETSLSLRISSACISSRRSTG